VHHLRGDLRRTFMFVPQRFARWRPLAASCFAFSQPAACALEEIRSVSGSARSPRGAIRAGHALQTALGMARR
jgi:hypothetical protein